MQPLDWIVVLVAALSAFAAAWAARRIGAARTRALRRQLDERQVMERALRESEERYRQMFERNRAPKWLVDPADGRIVDANPAACEFYGYPREQLIAMRVSDINTLSRDGLAATMRRVADGDTDRLRFSHRLASGDTREVEVYSGPVEVDGRRLLYSIIHDVSARVRAEDTLRARETRFRAVFEGSSDAIGVFLAGLYVMSNRAYQRMYGWSHEELVGKPPTVCLAPEEHARVNELALRRAAGEDMPTEYETIGLRRDGSRFAMEVHASTYLEGGQRFTIVLIRDITERKRHEEEVGALLIERERLIAELQEQRERMPLACLVTDRDLRLTYWNGAAERIFGWPREEALGRCSPELIVAERHRERVMASISRARGGETAPVINENITRDGRTITCEWYTVPLPSATGEPESTMWLAMDVTERGRLEERLRQAQKMEAIGRLAGGVAHDFNNLLSVITGYGEMVAQGLEPAHPLRGHADQMLKAAWRAAQLTRQLLAFGRRQVLQPRVIDLNAVVGDLGKLLRRVIGEHIELATDLAATGRVRADPGQLEQVLMNLALNARDAMPGGGRLTIATSDLEIAGAAATGDLRAGNWVALRVGDTGHGIDSEVRARLFEPFFTTKEAGKGTGLGLATAYGIVAQSGGTIVVESDPGRGATFSVLLPRADDAAAAVAASPSVGSRTLPAGSGTVLLIEDEPQLRELVRLTLERAGYELIEAGDGEQALRVLERVGLAIDLVVTDVIMPRLGGPELVARMAALGIDPPVLYMSGYAEGRLVDQALAGGRALFLEKPFTAEALLRAVAAALEGAAAPPTPPGEGRAAG